MFQIAEHRVPEGQHDPGSLLQRREPYGLSVLLRRFIGLALALIFLFCLCFHPLQAREGIVETRDGRIYQGHVRLESNLLVVVSAERDLLAFVAPTNLAELSFPKETPEADGEIYAGERVLPAPWQAEDVGKASLAGQAAGIGSVFLLRSSGTNIIGQSDAFHFVYKEVQGDSEIVARVLRVESAAPWAKAGLMMREGLGADARNVFLAATPQRVGVLQWRDTAGDATRGEVHRDLLAPGWLRLRREGNTFTASKSRNGRQWSLAARIEIPMRENILVGMALAGAVDSNSEQGQFPRARATLDNVREAPFLLNDSFTPAVHLQSGSVVVGRIRSANERQIDFAGAAAPEPISTRNVARILFRWLPDGLSWKVAAGQPGVLLSSGEFVEGDFKGIERGRVKISSVLLGIRSFDLNNELIALVLRKPSAGARLYEVKTTGGSLWIGAALQIEKDHLILQERSLGAWKIPLYEVMELRRRANTG